MKTTELNNKIWLQLSERAWQVRENAVLIGNTKVGAALLSSNGLIFCGCNIEHRYRCHDIHAEVNVISNMVAGGERTFRAILIAAERKKFTPCGGCMDWIMELGGPDCVVAYQNEFNGIIHKFLAKDLMPEYPM